MPLPLFRDQGEPPSSHLLARPRLSGAALGSAARVITVIAPSGYGKSTLLAEVHAASARPSIYLPLGPDHREPAALWRALARAITDGGQLPVGDLSRLSAPNPPSVEVALAGWLDALDDIDGPPLLLIDDLHRALSHAVLPGLSALISRGSGLTVVFSSQAPLRLLPLDDLAARGEVMALDAEELSFTEEESRALLGTWLGEPLAAELAPALHERAQGWPAGIQLAALAARAAPDPRAWAERFAHSDRTITDLGVEVWDQLDPKRRSALLRLSVVRDFDPHTVAALTDVGDGAAFISSLIRDGLFLTPAPAGRHRFHGMLAELLARQLERAGPAMAREVRRTAAHALAQPRPAESFDLMWRAGDLEEARGILGRSAWARIAEGEAEAVARDLARLGLRTDDLDPPLLVNACWAWFLSGRRVQLEAGLARLTTLEEEAPLEPLAASQLLNLRAGIARQAGDILGSISHARRALAIIPGSHPSLRGSTALYLGTALHHFGRHEEASEAFITCTRAAPQGEPLDVSRATAWGMWGQARHALGRFSEARRSLEAVAAELESMAPPGGRPPPVLGMILTELGRVALELGEVDEAEALLSRGIQLAAAGGLAEVAQVGRVSWARGLRMLGRPGDARAQLELLEATRKREALSVWVELRFVAERIHHAIAEGRATEAAMLLDAQQDFLLMPPSLNNEELVLASAAYALATRSPGLGGQLADLLRGATQTGRAGLELRVRLYQAALAAPGDEAQAAEPMREALRLARRERHLLPFAEVAAAQPTLRAAAAGLRDLGARVFAGQIVRWLEGLRAPDPQAQAGALSSGDRALVEALAGGAADDDVARSLDIPLASVRDRLRRLYLRAGVHRREQLVARARELGWL